MEEEEEEEGFLTTINNMVDKKGMISIPTTTSGVKNRITLLLLLFENEREKDSFCLEVAW